MIAPDERLDFTAIEKRAYHMMAARSIIQKMLSRAKRDPSASRINLLFPAFFDGSPVKKLTRS